MPHLPCERQGGTNVGTLKNLQWLIQLYTETSKLPTDTEIPWHVHEEIATLGTLWMPPLLASAGAGYG